MDNQLLNWMTATARLKAADSFKLVRYHSQSQSLRGDGHFQRRRHYAVESLHRAKMRFQLLHVIRQCIGWHKTWLIFRSPDGNTLILSSTDGYCSVVSFEPQELGIPMPADHISKFIAEHKEEKSLGVKEPKAGVCFILSIIDSRRNHLPLPRKHPVLTVK